MSLQVGRKLDRCFLTHDAEITFLLVQFHCWIDLSSDITESMIEADASCVKDYGFGKATVNKPSSDPIRTH